MKRLISFGLLAALFLGAGSASAAPLQKVSMTTKSTTPPVAARKPHSFEQHGTRIEDPYFWLRDPDYPKVDDAEVLDYLKAENAYFESQMAPLTPLIDTIFQEMKGRIKEDDSSVPQKDGDYLYWRRFQLGAQYKQWLRKPVKGGAEAIIIDEAKLGSFKTKDLVSKLANLKLSNATFIVDSVDENFDKASRNIPHLKVLPTEGANVYDILHHETLVLTENAVKLLTGRLATEVSAEAPAKAPAKKPAAKAVKANKRPSKGVTFGAEDNAIAAAIMARKATA